MQQLQLDGKFSDRDMLKIARFVRRETCSANIIEPNFEQRLIEDHKMLDDYFETTTIVPRIPLSPKPLTICSNTAALQDLIAQQHGRQIRAIHHGGN